MYGNDDPTTATQVTSGLLQHYPHLAGIISPTTVGIAAAAGVLDTPQYRGKVQLTGLGTPLSMKKFVDDGTVQAFELWNPAKLGYLAAYAGVELASKKLTATPGQSFTAGKLGKFTIASDNVRSCSDHRRCSTRPTSTSSTSSHQRPGGSGARTADARAATSPQTTQCLDDF